MVSVFVSSKQGELDLERAIVRQQIKAAGLCPVLAEDWTPGRKDSREVYLAQVRSCPVYVGIFYQVFSEATAEEYQAATANPYREILIYERRTTEGLRDDRLKQLLKDILSRHVVCRYDNPQELLELVCAHLRVAITHMIELLMNLGREQEAPLDWGKVRDFPRELSEQRDFADLRQEYLLALGFENGEFSDERLREVAGWLRSCLEWPPRGT